MKKYLISLSLPFLLVGCYAYRPISYDAMPSVSSSLDDDGFSCYHEGKKYSTGSVVKINGVTKECDLSFWLDSNQKRKDQNDTTRSQGGYIDNQTSYGGKIGEIKKQNTGQFCYFNGQRYSHGAELSVKNKYTVCRNGSWEESESLPYFEF